MELRHLRCFLAAGKELNLTRAAAQLRVAQPALSRTIQDLEDELGTALLKRSPRGVTLTPAGKLFLGRTEEILNAVEDSVQQLRGYAGGNAGELNIGYAASPTVEILPPALAAFQKANPKVSIVLHDLSQRETLEGLRDGTVELALMPLPKWAAHGGMEFEQLRQYPLCVVCAPDHRFARLKSVPLKSFAAEPIVALRRKDFPDYHEYLAKTFARLGMKPHIAVECDSGSSLTTAVESGRGVALAIAPQKQSTGKRVIYRPLADSAQTMPIGIVRRKEAELSPAGNRFCELLRKTAQR